MVKISLGTFPKGTFPKNEFRGSKASGLSSRKRPDKHKRERRVTLTKDPSDKLEIDPLLELVPISKKWDGRFEIPKIPESRQAILDRQLMPPPPPREPKKKSGSMSQSMENMTDSGAKKYKISL